MSNSYDFAPINRPAGRRFGSYKAPPYEADFETDEERRQRERDEATSSPLAPEFAADYAARQRRAAAQRHAARRAGSGELGAMLVRPIEEPFLDPIQRREAGELIRGAGEALGRVPGAVSRFVESVPGAVQRFDERAPGAIQRFAEGVPGAVAQAPEAGSRFVSRLSRDVGEAFAPQPMSEAERRRRRESMRSVGADALYETTPETPAPAARVLSGAAQLPAAIAEGIVRPYTEYPRLQDEQYEAIAGGDDEGAGRAARGALGESAWAALNLTLPVDAAAIGMAGRARTAARAPEASRGAFRFRPAEEADFAPLPRPPSAAEVTQPFRFRQAREEELLPRNLPRRGGVSFADDIPASVPAVARPRAPISEVPSAELDLVGDFAEPVSRSGRSNRPIVPLSIPGAIAGGAAGAAALSAGDAQAQEGPDPELARARERVVELDRALAALDNAIANSGDREAVTAAQRVLNVRVDGNWGNETRTAANQRRDQLRVDRAEAQKRVAEFEQAEAARRTTPPPWVEPLREFGPFVGYGIGALAGHRMRGGAALRVGEEIAARNRAANALLDPNAVLAGRTAAAQREPLNRAMRINRFWEEGIRARPRAARRPGDELEVPFRTSQTKVGFTQRGNAAAPESLYPPDNRLFRGQDYMAVAGALVESLGATGASMWAQSEIDKAQAAVDRAQRESNAAHLEQAQARLERWRTIKAAAETFANAGRGYILGRAGAAYRHRYPNDRPDVPAASSERGALNQFLARRR